VGRTALRYPVPVRRPLQGSNTLSSIPMTPQDCPKTPIKLPIAVAGKIPHHLPSSSLRLPPSPGTTAYAPQMQRKRLEPETPAPLVSPPCARVKQRLKTDCPDRSLGSGLPHEATSGNRWLMPPLPPSLYLYLGNWRR